MTLFHFLMLFARKDAEAGSLVLSSADFYCSLRLLKTLTNLTPFLPQRGIKSLSENQHSFIFYSFILAKADSRGELRLFGRFLLQILNDMSP